VDLLTDLPPATAADDRGALYRVTPWSGNKVPCSAFGIRFPGTAGAVWAIAARAGQRLAENGHPWQDFRQEKDMLDKKVYLIREHVGLLKLSDTYDILDPQTQQQIGIARERPGTLVHLLRLLVNKRLLPTSVHVYEGADSEDQSKLQFSIRRGFTMFRSKVDVLDAKGNVLGWLQSKLLSIGGAFRVFDASGNEVALVQGDWKGWNFRITDNHGKELGTIAKKWAGLAKELFTSADTYAVALTGDADPANATLLLAAGLAVDTVYKEGN
jgi:uncharacterized protein YxjI